MTNQTEREKEMQDPKECPNCGLEIDPDGSGNLLVDGIDGDTYCHECQIGDQVDASVIRFEGDQTEGVSFAGGVAIELGQNLESTGDYWSDVEELPDWYRLNFSLPSWVSTDAWRGYTDVKILEGSKLISAGNGWTTGWPDETVSRKYDVNALAERLRGDPPDFAVYEVTGTTSNLFSIGLEYFVSKYCIDNFKDYAGFDLEAALG